MKKKRCFGLIESLHSTQTQTQLKRALLAFAFVDLGVIFKGGRMLVDLERERGPRNRGARMVLILSAVPSALMGPPDPGLACLTTEVV